MRADGGTACHGGPWMMHSMGMSCDSDFFRNFAER